MVLSGALAATLPCETSGLSVLATTRANFAIGYTGVVGGSREALTPIPLITSAVLNLGYQGNQPQAGTYDWANSTQSGVIIGHGGLWWSGSDGGIGSSTVIFTSVKRSQPEFCCVVTYEFHGSAFAVLPGDGGTPGEVSVAISF